LLLQISLLPVWLVSFFRPQLSPQTVWLVSFFRPQLSLSGLSFSFSHRQFFLHPVLRVSFPASGWHFFHHLIFQGANLQLITGFLPDLFCTFAFNKY
jgi:hypothetical protein